MQPDEDAAPLERTLARVMGRMLVAHCLYGLAAGIATSVLVGAAGVAGLGHAADAIVAGAIVFATRRTRTRHHAAALIERAAPECRNTIVTAEELLAHPDRASARMRARVLRDAARFASAVQPSAVRPLRLPLAVLLTAFGVSVVVGRTPARLVPALLDMARAAVPGRGRVASLTVIVEPPAYTGRPATRQENPDHLEALAGSTARLSIQGDPRAWRLRLGTRDVPWPADGVAAVRLIESGYFALEPAAGTAAAPRLLPVTVVPDQAPSVHVEAPARDLVVPDAARQIRVIASASDDLGLDSLEFRYTKVSGTGEDFEFVEGTLPMQIARTSDQAWKGTASVALDRLQLEPGDSLVYHAVAKDRRPAGGEASSDTFFIEIAGPGQIPLEGFELPPDQERYALSQQMVVLKIERLRARESALSRDALLESTLTIAAEQRAVRANFIFLMGGHVEDEEVEAAQSSEIQEGRLENTARREISTAVNLMTRVEQGLMSASTSAALPPAKSAVEALQRAFGRNRYILRTPPSRTEIDQSRRLSGSLSGAASWRRERSPAARDPERDRTGAFVAAALAVAKRLTTQAPDPAWFRTLAEQALAVDPAAREWQQAAARLSTVADMASSGAPPAAIVARLGEAVRPALDAARSSSRPPATTGTSRATPLGRAWAEESKR